MPSKSKRAKLKLNMEQHQNLLKISQSRTAPYREVQRAQILLEYAADKSIMDIKRQLKVHRHTIYKCIDKALAMGPEAGLKDIYHQPKEPVITEEAKTWVVNLACTKPTEHGYAAEVWTLEQLAKHTRTYAPAAGHDSLEKAVKATIYRILEAHPIKPHKIKYYLERRDPEFETKMNEVLVIYQEINFQNDHPDMESKVITVSVDEKPGIQALKNIAPDLPPAPGHYPQTGRDYEYKRLGTMSLLAALDLHDGHITAQVHDRHRSREFIQLLKELDTYYPPDYTIRLILDNHSAHTSQETRKYLATRPNRFLYIHTPKHGSWLNLVETLFGKMARTFLKYIRVQSKSELSQRIMQGIAEINAAPVIHRWKKFGFAAA